MAEAMIQVYIYCDLPEEAVVGKIMDSIQL